MDPSCEDKDDRQASLCGSVSGISFLRINGHRAEESVELGESEIWVGDHNNADSSRQALVQKGLGALEIETVVGVGELGNFTSSNNVSPSFRLDFFISCSWSVSVVSSIR